MRAARERDSGEKSLGIRMAKASTRFMIRCDIPTFYSENSFSKMEKLFDRVVMHDPGQLSFGVRLASFARISLATRSLLDRVS